MRSVLYAILVVLSVLTLSPVSGEPRLRPGNWAVPLINTSLNNSYKVDDHLYRSAQPEHEDVIDIESIGIKSVLNLREYHSDDDEIESSTIKLHRVAMNAGRITEEQISKALTIIKQQQEPVLVHCWHGSDRTGAVVAAYRIVFNKWTKQQAVDELVNGGYGYHSRIYPNVVELIQNLDVKSIKTRLNMGNQNIPVN